MSDVILSKIKKLFALAGSSNEAEASSAMLKAHSLLKEHNLSITDIKEDNVYSISEEEFFAGTRERKWRTLLVSAVAKANYCATLRTLNRTGFTLRLVGKEHNIVTTKLMLEYLIQVIERLSKNIEVSGRESYKLGVVISLQNRLKKVIEEERVECTSLVVQEEASINQYFKNKNVTSKSISCQIRNASAYNRGCADGDKISLNQQVGTPVFRNQLSGQ